MGEDLDGMVWAGCRIKMLAYFDTFEYNYRPVFQFYNQHPKMNCLVQVK